MRLVLLILLFSAAARADASCEAIPAIREALDAIATDASAPPRARAERVKALLDAHPDDLFVHEAWVNALSGPLNDYAGALARYRELHTRAPDDPRWSYL